jgi:hypothetical protein
MEAGSGISGVETHRGDGMTARTILKRFLWSLGVWFLIAGLCILSGFFRPSYFPYIGLALIYGWYFSIPVLFVVVSVVSFATHAVRARNGSSRR